MRSKQHAHDRDVKLGETALDFTNIDLFQLPVSDVVFLIDHASTGTSDRCRRKRCSKNKTGGIRPDHVDEIIRASNVTANRAISLAESACQERKGWVVICAV